MVDTMTAVGKWDYATLAEVFVDASTNRLINRTHIPEITKVKNKELFEIMRWKIPYRFASVKTIGDINIAIHRLIVYSMESVKKRTSARDAEIIATVKQQIADLEIAMTLAQDEKEKKLIDSDIKLKHELLKRLDRSPTSIFEDRQKIGTVARRVYNVLTKDNRASDILYDEIKLQVEPIKKDDTLNYSLPNSARDRKFDASGNSVKSFVPKDKPFTQQSGNWKEKLRATHCTSDTPKYCVMQHALEKKDTIYRPCLTATQTTEKKEAIYTPACLKQTPDKDDSQKKTYVPPQHRPDYKKNNDPKFVAINQLTDYGEEFPSFGSKPCEQKSVTNFSVIKAKYVKEETWDDENESTQNEEEQTPLNALSKCTTVALEKDNMKILVSVPKFSFTMRENWGENDFVDDDVTESPHSQKTDDENKAISSDIDDEQLCSTQPSDSPISVSYTNTESQRCETDSYYQESNSISSIDSDISSELCYESAFKYFNPSSDTGDDIYLQECYLDS